MSHVCPPHYQMINNTCYHYLWPPTLSIVLGSLLLGFSNSLATLAGLGGASISLVILMSFFEYLPKDATLVVFSCVLGTATGNTMNLIYKAYNQKPLIQYKFAFVSLPIMFAGSFIGVLLNKLFPSIITYSIIVCLFSTTIKKSYTRFIAEYQKETEQILLHTGNIQDFHEQSRINPFKDQKIMYILKNLGFLMLIVITLSFMRGSSKFPSIIGLQPCTSTYWFLYVCSFLIVIVYTYRNIQIFKTWYSNNQKQGQNLYSNQYSQLSSHMTELIQKSVGAGIISGFGLGGGMFLVPMYRNLGCKPMQAAATCAFGIFITSFINCLQAISIGAIQVSQFGYFFIFMGIVSNIVSRVISNELKKRNRFSLVEGIFFVLQVIAAINIPISLYRRYVDSGYNSKIILSFGRIC